MNWIKLSSKFDTEDYRAGDINCINLSCITRVVINKTVIKLYQGRNLYLVINKHNQKAFTELTEQIKDNLGFV